ncbi:U3 small nucleolar RNA-associated 4 [Hyphodiscus hymeniophilus]|uniref:U3 small nucleolar RNA-associated 4 n=1 Tax=Hyphodiscus hymeniophilus TaxID=353542 RepID=A0A9P6SQS7_9HELO|nr:U3 small nucleolar RNA-associated 4 [Hyphodiscus hymeniophilus]
MDIHRCRFVPYPPSTINALAFSHSHISKGQKTSPPRLAVGRANGDIEIWNPLNGSWLQETIIRGGKDRSVDGLVWTQDPNEKDSAGKTIVGKSRLFSVGYTTTVTEWDLERGQPLRQASGNHGEIWCLAAQPALTPSAHEANGTQGEWQGQKLITGCTDGALVLYSTKDDDLQLQQILVRPSSKKAKIISVAFQGRNVVVAGCTDSTIRIYDARNGTNLRNMSLGSGPAGGPKEIIVWSVKVLQGGNIVSGDSTGELRLWDGKTYTLTQRIKGHKQDILSLATSFDGTTIFSGGMDRRTVVYKQVGKGKSRWAEVGHRRYHTHDVKAMASFEHKAVSIVVSGGPDASPTIMPLRQFGMENQRSLPFMSQESPVRSAPRSRLMMSFWDREVHIWRLNKQSKITPENEDVPVDNRQLVAKILIKGEANIRSANLSADGSLLAASTATDIKLFHLKARKSEEGSGGLRISKITIPGGHSGGARIVEFSPDGKWLCIIRADSRITLARLLSSASSTVVHEVPAKLTRLNRNIEKRILLGGLGTYDRCITQVAFSHDSRILAVSDIAGYVDTWVLSGVEDLMQTNGDIEAASASDSEDSDSEEDAKEEGAKTTPLFGQNWTRNPAASSIPKVPATPTVLSFRPNSHQKKATSNGATHVIPTRHNPNPIAHDLPSGEDRLLVVTATGDVFEFEVLKGSLSPWSRHNPTSAFPIEFTKLKDQARGCVWDISESRERLWLYGVGWLWMFDLSRDLPPDSQKLVNGESPGRKGKRKNGKEEDSGAGSMIPDKMLGTGMSRKMQRIIHEEIDESHEIQFGDPNVMDIDDEDEDDSPDLERLRRGSGSGEDQAVEVVDGNDVVETKPHYWRTFKYRPILGMCVIGEGDDGDIGPEVAILERPIWEADLGPRYVGDQEWEKPGV